MGVVVGLVVTVVGTVLVARTATDQSKDTNSAKMAISVAVQSANVKSG